MAEANNNGNQRTAREVQQEFADKLGYAEQIIWDLLSEEQAHLLEDKLRQLIRDPQPSENNNELVLPALTPELRIKEEKERTKLINDNKKAREAIFKAVWEQRKYTNRQSLTAIIYVMVIADEKDVNRAEDCTKFSCHPVFRARRCITESSGRSGDSSDCCNIFVDENGRVYQNWEQYVATNELPAGIMVAPERGIYRLVKDHVRLDKYVTPAGSDSRKVLGFLDVGSAVGGFAAAGVSIAALCTLPVSAPLLAGAGVVGLASAGYGTARSAAKLVDRSQHEQSINVTDREARSHWLGTIAGVIGLGAAGATQAVTVATNAGREVGAITQLTVNGMNITSIAISGTGLANGILDMILKVQDGDDITTIDVLQLSASLVLFTHSVYNFKLASTIINDTANKNLAGYRETLSNRQRRMFDKTYKETIRINGNRAKVDIIRNVNEIPSRQQFNDLYKINKQLNKEGVRFSFGSDGKTILLNGEVQTTTADLRASVQHNQGPNILGKVTQSIPASHVNAANVGTTTGSRIIGPQPSYQPRQEPRNYAVGVFALELSSVVIGGMVFVLESYGRVIFEHIANAEAFENIIESMCENLPPEVFDFIMKLTRTFMDTMLDDLTSVLKFFITTESVLYRILMYVLNNFRNVPVEVLEQHTGDIFRGLKRYYLSLNPNNYTGLLQKCQVCTGFFQVSQL